MSLFYFTFGQSHYSLDTGTPLKDYWVEISAHSAEAARDKMFSLYQGRWGMQYSEKQFMKNKYFEHYPKGCLARYKVT